MERTLIILKPDAVQRGLSGEILSRFERKGIQIVGMKFMKIPTSLAEIEHDELDRIVVPRRHHSGEPFAMS